jgi:DNA-binding transcriptional MerR regulator
MIGLPLSNFEDGFPVPIPPFCGMLYTALKNYIMEVFCMGEVHYMISEAARKVQVESHVLRYWEDELQIAIGRNEMGHRYYTDEDIQLFNCIKELKEQGMSLKVLKELIPELLRAKRKSTEKKRRQAGEQILQTDEWMQQLEIVMRNAFREVLTQNNQVLKMDMGESISTQVVNEMDSLMRAREEREEERFRKIDALIRRQQVMHKEMAVNGTRHGAGKMLPVFLQPARNPSV